MGANDKKIWDFFLSKIGNQYGVAALMGNLYVESHLDSYKLQSTYERKLGMTGKEYTDAVDNGTYTDFINDKAGYGLAQWTYWSRKEGLYNYCISVSSSIGNLDMQLDYLWKELQGYKTVLNALYNATDVRSASDVVAIKYENPKNQDEEFLANRAKYGQSYYDEYAKEESMVNSWKKVETMLAEWKAKGLDKPTIVVNLANACIGWNYIFGDRGEECTPSHVKSRVSSLKADYPKESESLKKRCQIADGKSSVCNGCKFYPNAVTLAYDCRGFTYWCFLKGANIIISGGGASSQYNNDSNWEEKGVISKMPKDKVCCTFRYDSSTGKYEHTLIYDGNGHYIHDSGEVKKCDVSKYKATHYAIPKGLYSGGGVTVEKKKVYAETGKTVNMRNRANISSDVIAQVPIGTIVDFVEKTNNEWSKIIYQNKTGYMMSKFLVDVDTPTPSEEYISVKKSDLQTVYDMVGKMLKG